MVFRCIDDFLPGPVNTLGVGGRQLARVSDLHVPWSRIPGWLKRLPAVYVLRDVLGWHLSRWLSITNVARPARVPGYMFRNNTTDPDGHFPWELPDHRQLAEEYLKGELSLASWSGLNAEGYWFFTQRINVRATTHGHLGFCPEWPGIGFYTMRILLMIHRNPDRLFRLSEPELEEYFESGRWRGDICRGWCLSHEHLTEDASRVLQDELGYRREDLDQALASMQEKMNMAEAGRRQRAMHELRENAALREEILQAERLAHRYLLPTLAGTEPSAATGLPAFTSPSGATVPSPPSEAGEGAPPRGEAHLCDDHDERQRRAAHGV